MLPEAAKRMFRSNGNCWLYPLIGNAHPRTSGTNRVGHQFKAFESPREGESDPMRKGRSFQIVQPSAGPMKAAEHSFADYQEFRNIQLDSSAGQHEQND